MSNWCANNLTLGGPSDAVREIWKRAHRALAECDSCLDGKVIPLLAILPEGILEVADDPDGLKEWCIRDPDFLMRTNKDGTTELEASFMSPWEPPVEAYLACGQLDGFWWVDAQYYEMDGDFAGYWRDWEQLHFEDIRSSIANGTASDSIELRRLIDEYSILDHVASDYGLF